MTRTFEAVTTFSAFGYEQYGRRMIETFAQHWPRAVSLTIYRDGFDLTEDDLPRGALDVCAIDMQFEAKYGGLSWFGDFKSRHARDPRANGMRNGSYDFRFDAVKFSNKTAAIIDAAETSSADVLIWLDGDIVTHAPVSNLDELMPENCLLSWLDRDRSCPETGFLIFNLRHPGIPLLMATWRAMYETDGVFLLPEWHDAFVLQRIVTDNPFSLRACSLSGETGRKTSHPLVNGPLGRCFDHLKGPRKAEGMSRRRDLHAPRPEAYWQ